VLEHGDTLTIFPSASKLHGAEIETYSDHRIAMCFSLAAASGKRVGIRDPDCVAKTFPEYFAVFASIAGFEPVYVHA
jgi:3-phosphoshikimate 1-carboxyvinyltransferase